MKFLTDKDVVQRFSDLILRVDRTGEWYGRQLIFNSELTEGQFRVGCGSPNKMSLLAFSHQLLTWFSSKDARLLWVSHVEDNFPSYLNVFNAARLGLGATSSIFESPGHLFEPAPYEEFDSNNLTSHECNAVALACGIISIIQEAGWDGWLISEGCYDRVEFWEGNVFFYSAVENKIKDAMALMERFQCPKLA
jgi:hypothetical protein